KRAGVVHGAVVAARGATEDTGVARARRGLRTRRGARTRPVRGRHSSGGRTGERSGPQRPRRGTRGARGCGPEVGRARQGCRMSGLVVVAALVAAVAIVRAARRARRAATPRSRALTVVIAVLALNIVLGAPAAMAQQCGEPPNPERPGTGMVGALDSAEARGEKDSPYRDYGYAGMVWHVYQTECGGLSGVTDANTTLDTWAGNQLFNVGKAIVGATNGLHYTVIEGGLFDPIYEAIEKGTKAVYNNIYAQLFGLAALLLAIWLFRHIWTGDLPAVSKKALFALGAVWLAASSFALLQYIDDVDRAIVRTTTSIQAGFVDESEERVVR